MKKGDQARETVKNTIIDAFKTTNSFVCIQDKKIYVTAQDGPAGETLQFAITMTMPKVPVSAENITMSSGENAIANTTTPVAAATPVEISPEDKKKVEELKAMLGIS